MLGSGGTSIGQAGEFDYSGGQAIKVRFFKKKVWLDSFQSTADWFLSPQRALAHLKLFFIFDFQYIERCRKKFGVTTKRNLPWLENLVVSKYREGGNAWSHKKGCENKRVIICTPQTQKKIETWFVGYVTIHKTFQFTPIKKRMMGFFISFYIHKGIFLDWREWYMTMQKMYVCTVARDQLFGCCHFFKRFGDTQTMKVLTVILGGNIDCCSCFLLLWYAFSQNAQRIAEQLPPESACKKPARKLEQLPPESLRSKRVRPSILMVKLVVVRRQR